MPQIWDKTTSESLYYIGGLSAESIITIVKLLVWGFLSWTVFRDELTDINSLNRYLLTNL